MKIWHKIMVAPGVAILFLMMLGAISYSVLTHQNSVLAELFENRFGNYQLAANSAQEIGDVHSDVYRLFTWFGNLKEDKIREITDEQNARIGTVILNMTRFAARADINADERKVADDIIAKLGKYKSDVDAAIDMSKTDVNMGMSAMQTADSDFQVMIKEFRSLVQIDQHLAQESYESASAAFGKAVMAMIVILLFALGASAGISLFMSRKIVRQIGGELDYAAEVAHKIAASDLSADVAIKPGDTRSMLFAMKNMQDSLREIVSEIQAIVQAAVQGDFSKKMDLGGKQGFGKEIATGLNQLSATTEAGLNDVMRVTSALAAGDLTQKITKDYPGVFGQTKNGVNNTVDSLTRIVGEIRNMVDAAGNHGDFTTRMDLTGKAGYARELSELLNQLSVVTVNGLNELARMLRALSQGNLDEKITGQYYGTFGQLKDDANRTADHLKEIIVSEVGRVASCYLRLNAAALMMPPSFKKSNKCPLECPLKSRTW